MGRPGKPGFQPAVRPGPFLKLKRLSINVDKTQRERREESKSQRVRCRVDAVGASPSERPSGRGAANSDSWSPLTTDCTRISIG